MCQAFEQWTFLKKGIPRVTTFFRVVLGGHLTFLLPSINVKNSNHREPSSYLLSSRAILHHLFSRAMHRKWLLDLQKNVRTTREILSLFSVFSKIVLLFLTLSLSRLTRLTCAVAETGHSRLGVLSRELLISTVALAALAEKRNFAKRKDFELRHATFLSQIRRYRNSTTCDATHCIPELRYTLRTRRIFNLKNQDNFQIILFSI